MNFFPENEIAKTHSSVTNLFSAIIATDLLFRGKIRLQQATDFVQILIWQGVVATAEPLPAVDARGEVKWCTARGCISYSRKGPAKFSPILMMFRHTAK
jgi:hypothetical protein